MNNKLNKINLGKMATKVVFTMLFAALTMSTLKPVSVSASEIEKKEDIPIKIGSEITFNNKKMIPGGTYTVSLSHYLEKGSASGTTKSSAVLSVKGFDLNEYKFLESDGMTLIDGVLYKEFDNVELKEGMIHNEVIEFYVPLSVGNKFQGELVNVKYTVEAVQAEIPEIEEPGLPLIPLEPSKPGQPDIPDVPDPVIPDVPDVPVDPTIPDMGVTGGFAIGGLIIFVGAGYMLYKDKKKDEDKE